MSDAVTAEPAAEPAVPKGHPLGLYLLFGTEMWERFSYYGMRALLVLYMIEQFGWQPSNASTVYKWYTSLVYLTPLVGGFLADRWLGLRTSIMIGAVLMAIGQFLLVLDPLPIFYTALAFLIAGNGFFKPNISTLVGRMYKQGDARRDGAFTIFYMGINLGAFLAPFICGGLRGHFKNFHYGFAAAGFGMLLGLVIFTLGQKRILADVAAAGNSVAVVKDEPKKDEKAPAAEDQDESAPGETGFAGLLAKAWPVGLLALAVLVPLHAIWGSIQGTLSVKDAVMHTALAAIAGWMGFILLRKIRGRARDKSTVIFVLFMFTVLFWMAFEQAGNALNIWAEFNTNRHLGSLEYSAESFQSVNPAFIFLLAPLFAMLWVWLARKNLNPSTPMKFLLAMFLMVMSFGAMVAGAAAENGAVTRVPLEALPARVEVAKLDAGRMTFDAGKKELEVRGVLPSFAVIEALEAAVDPAYKADLAKVEDASKSASKEKPAKVVLAALPQGAHLELRGEDVAKAISDFDPETRTLTIIGSVGGPAKRALLAAAAPSAWREAVDAASDKSQAARVSGFWLFLSYLLATLGELCLSPVGLSMVTKLAPARFASLFMGVWLLASSVAQYLGGSLGELWGVIAPVSYFTIFVGTSLAGAVVLALLVVPVRKLMHGVV
jgi:POT family proton-dependent oligopeptide transporter